MEKGSIRHKIQHLTDEIAEDGNIKGVNTFGWQITNMLHGSPFPVSPEDGKVYSEFIDEMEICHEIVKRKRFSSYYYWWKSDLYNDWSQRAVLIWDTMAASKLLPIRIHTDKKRECTKKQNPTPTFKWNRVLPESTLCKRRTYKINYKKISHSIVDSDQIKIIQYIVLFNFSKESVEKKEIDCYLEIFYLNSYSGMYTYDMKSSNYTKCSKNIEFNKHNLKEK